MGYVFGSKVSLYYKAEGTRGTLAQATQWRYPSDSIENFTLTGANGAEITHTMNSYAAGGTIDGPREYTMSFDYYLQRHGSTSSSNDIDSSLEKFSITRDVDGNLTPLSFCVCPTSTTTISCLGGAIENLSIGAPAGERIKCSVSLKFSDVTTAGGTTRWHGPAPAALGTTYETMNSASLTRTSWFTNGVANFNATVDNGVESLRIIGTRQPAATYEGKENLTGSCDVFLNSTGTYEWDQVYAGAKDTMTFSTGDSVAAADASMKFTFTNVMFTETVITSSTDTTALQSGLPWIATGVALAIHS